MRTTIFCNHYRAMSEHKTCKVDVAYDSFKGVPFEDKPCFCKNGQPPNAGCSLMEMPTPERLAAENKKFAKLFARTAKARAAIVEHLGGHWKRGMTSQVGEIDCPVCDGKATLRFIRAGYNGHIHASCKTEGCVSWYDGFQNRTLFYVGTGISGGYVFQETKSGKIEVFSSYSLQYLFPHTPPRTLAVAATELCDEIQHYTNGKDGLVTCEIINLMIEVRKLAEESKC